MIESFRPCPGCGQTERVEPDNQVSRHFHPDVQGVECSRKAATR